MMRGKVALMTSNMMFFKVGNVAHGLIFYELSINKACKCKL